MADRDLAEVPQKAEGKELVHGAFLVQTEDLVDEMVDPLDQKEFLERLQREESMDEELLGVVDSSKDRLGAIATDHCLESPSGKSSGKSEHWDREDLSHQHSFLGLDPFELEQSPSAIAFGPQACQSGCGAVPQSQSTLSWSQ